MKSAHSHVTIGRHKRIGQTGRIPSRLPFLAARETPCGFLLALFRNEKAVIQVESCTLSLHSSYTAKMLSFKSSRMNNF